MDRMSLDLGIARDKVPFPMKQWKYLFVGECSGNVLIALGSPKGSPLDPDEFDKLTEIDMFRYLYITNNAQPDKYLNIYYEEGEKEEIVEVNKW